MKRLTIGLAGHRQVGKSTLAAMLLAMAPEAEIIGFADALKDEFLEIMHRMGRDITLADLEREKSSLYGPGLQFWGEYRRQKDGADYWLRRWEAEAGGASVIVPDVRHINEADLIQARGGLLVYVAGPNRTTTDLRDMNHPSEWYMDQLHGRADLIVRNGGSLDTLRSFASHILVMAGMATAGLGAH